MSGAKGEAPPWGWLAGTGTVLSLASCYGSLGVVAILSVMGVNLAINVHIWAASIVLFAVVAAVGVSLGYLRHRKAIPMTLAVIGTLLVAAAMYGAGAIQTIPGLSSRAIELIGFAALVIAAIWDWRLKRALA